MLKFILENKESINKIFSDNHAKEWKVFGSVISEEGFTTYIQEGQINFLIFPGEYMCERKWRNIKIELMDLFPHSYYIRCVTPDTLNGLIKMKELTKERAAIINLTAKNLLELEMMK